MAPKKNLIPTPEQLLEEIEGKPSAKQHALDEYMEAVHAVKQKGYSYAYISEFLSERLGGKFSKGQVFRYYKQWLKVQNSIDEAVASGARFADGDADLPPDLSGMTEEEQREYEVEQDAKKIRECMEELFPDDESRAHRAWGSYPELLEAVAAPYIQAERDEREADEEDRKAEAAKKAKKANAKE